MKIYLAHNGLQYQKDLCELFEKGLKRHGFSSTVDHINNLRRASLLLIWGGRFLSKFKTFASDILVMECAYFEPRRTWVSLGFNGLNGKANFVNKNSPSDRWEKYFNDGRLKPWSKGDYFLVTLQVPRDNSLSDNRVTYEQIIRNLKKFGLPILVKNHPMRTRGSEQEKIYYDSQVIEVDRDIPISELVDGAKATITISSNTGVDSILAGTPVMNFSKHSMVWGLAMKEYDQLKNPPMPDRTQWCYDMAYTQWLSEEIENGDAWDHLKRFYD